MYIPQIQLERLKKRDALNKVIVVYGPRRCGKTTLLTEYVKNLSRPYLFVTGDDQDIHYYLSGASLSRIKNFAGGYSTIVIDEAQRIQGIGMSLKLMVDMLPGIRVIASGSSSFELAQNIGEPLTGRKSTLHLYPLSQMELAPLENAAQTRALLENRLIYGTFPEIVLAENDKQRMKYLREFTDSYLFKDVLALEGLRRSRIVENLLRLIAFQTGKEVSLNELGTQLGISKNTVDRYLGILEQAFILMSLNAFSKNLRKEISKSRRYYFYDNGIRNTLINNFKPLELRNDQGELWENYIVMERIKKQHYRDIASNNYFWRTYDQKEIDLVEERDGRLYGFEIKWGTKTAREPLIWKKTYPESEYTVINKDNYLGFIV